MAPLHSPKGWVTALVLVNLVLVLVYGLNLLGPKGKALERQPQLVVPGEPREVVAHSDEYVRATCLDGFHALERDVRVQALRLNGRLGGSVECVVTALTPQGKREDVRMMCCFYDDHPHHCSSYRERPFPVASFEVESNDGGGR